MSARPFRKGLWLAVGLLAVWTVTGSAEDQQPARNDSPDLFTQAEPPEGGEPGQHENRKRRILRGRERHLPVDDSPGQRHHRGSRVDLSPERIQEMLEKLKQYDPQLAKRIEQAGQNHPDGLEGVLREPGSRSLRKIRQMESDPEMFALSTKEIRYRRETRNLAKRYRSAEGQEVNKIYKQVENMVGEHFDVRQQMKELRLKRAEKELERLRKIVVDRSEARERLIKKQCDLLVGEHDDGPTF